MKITKDGFIWKVISFDEAKVLFSSGALEIYQLRDNDVEALIQSIEDLNECFERDIEIGISVGEIDTDICKEVLENRGYFTYNLWCVADVKGKFKCDDEQAHEVLQKAFKNDATYEQIWLSIDCAGESLGLEKIEEI